MTARQGQEYSDFARDYDQDCAIEFIDPKFLAFNTLNSDFAALDYFYQSPFYLAYRENCLNEKIRAGQTVDSNEAGLIFQVTYSNLDQVHAMTAARPEDRTPNLYVNYAVFHVTLYSREFGNGDVTNTPIKLYYIIQGSIFRCPPFGSLVRQGLHKGMREFERFYDYINNMSSWSITNGYTWEPKPRELDPSLEALCSRYNFQRKSYDDFAKKDEMHVFYLRPNDNLGISVARNYIKKAQQTPQS